MRKSYPYIDFLKVVGLFCIILAHVNPPAFIMQLRNFDVPMMVILSGLLASMKNEENSGGGYISVVYYKKRLLRLIVPTWIVLSLYFIAFWIVKGFVDYKILIKSFLFQQDSIGYVWIIWVYVITAFLTPILIALYERLGKTFLFLYFFLYIEYEILVFLKIGISNRLLIYSVYYAIPYGGILLFGLLYNKFSYKEKLLISVFALLIYIAFAVAAYLIKGRYVPTQAFKYPPRMYWISYAIGISYFLMIICERFENCNLFDNCIIRFIGRNTLWIYLWHIPLVLVSVKISGLWFIRFFIIVFGAVLMDFIQNGIGEQTTYVIRFFVGWHKR